MHVVLQVLATAQVLQKEAQRIFRPHGLTAAQFNVLHLLSGQSEGMRASDLARALIVDPSNVTGLLKRMKQVGLLEELDNPRDRRQHVVAVSARGRSAWRAALRDYERNLAALDAVLGAANRKAAEKVLQQLAATAATLRSRTEILVGAAAGEAAPRRHPERPGSRAGDRRSGGPMPCAAKGLPRLRPKLSEELAGHP